MNRSGWIHSPGPANELIRQAVQHDRASGRFSSVVFDEIERCGLL